MTDTTETSAIINRHMARLLSDLEDAACPAIFRDAVKTELVWLRDDLTNRKDSNDDRGNR